MGSNGPSTVTSNGLTSDCVLADGFASVPAGRVATIVTSLEMTSRPGGLVPTPLPQGVALERVTLPDLDWYRQLFRSVGEDWLWFSRLRLDDAQLSAVVHDPNVHVHALTVPSPTGSVAEAGILELDFRTAGQCEIAFFGLKSAFLGQGLGRDMMNAAIERAWRQPITRLWVHTCTLDHPAALAFYRRSGFNVYRQQVEIALDPRVAGELPRTAGPHVPIIE